AMLPLVQFVAVLATTVFAGAALYINLVEHPARMSCRTDVAATVWAPSYERATLMQAPLAVVGGLASALAWWLGARLTWLVAGFCPLAVLPVTLLVIFPTNHRLLAPGRDLGSAETRTLLVTWGRLHAIRSLLGLIASIMLIWQIVKR